MKKIILICLAFVLFVGCSTSSLRLLDSGSLELNYNADSYLLTKKVLKRDSLNFKDLYIDRFKLEDKNTSELHIKAICQDIVAKPLDISFDGIISSMTLHHVQNLSDFFTSIYKNINANGFLAIADLEIEDGTFHSDNTGVYHFGFEKNELCSILEKSGFKNVAFERVTTINKPQRDFGVFLLTAQK